MRWSRPGSRSWNLTLSCRCAATLNSNILSVHESIYRRMYLRLGIDLYEGVQTGYYGTCNREE